MEKIRLLLADDHEIVRNGIHSLLMGQEGFEVVAMAENGQEALEKAKTLQPDLLILDIRMPVMNGIEAIKFLPDYSSSAKSLILSMHDHEEYILNAMKAGASGYILKDASKEEFIKAIYSIIDGKKYFSGSLSDVIVENYLQQITPNEQKQFSPDTYNLSKTETLVLNLLADGVSNKEIAEQLGKSIRTIETHRFNIMKKMGVNNVVTLLKKVIDENLKG